MISSHFLNMARGPIMSFIIQQIIEQFIEFIFLLFVMFDLIVQFLYFLNAIDCPAMCSQGVFAFEQLGG